MIPPLLELALGYYRSPLAYGHLADPAYPLPVGFPVQLADLCSAIAPGRILDVARRMDSTPEEVEAAVRFFARRVLLDPANDDYRALGLPPDASADSIRKHYRLLIKLFHPDRLDRATSADLACSRRLNAAYRVLSDPEQRARYDRETLGNPSQVRFSDPRGFFGSNHAALQTGTRPPRAAAASRRRRRTALALGTGTILVAALGGALWLTEPEHPLRRVAPPTATRDLPRPSYLREPDTRTGPVQSDTAGFVGPRHQTPERLAANRDAAEVSDIGARVVSELQIAIRRGDTGKLQQLFASDSATGLQRLLGESSPLVIRAAGGQARPWMTLTNMHWRRGADGEIQGRGRLFVEPLSSAEFGTKGVTATIELTLAADAPGYRISAMRLQRD